MTDIRLLSDEDDALAAEYVIGLLDGPTREIARKRRRVDAAFAARVSIWEAYLEGLNTDYGTQTPPARVKAGIDRRLFGPAKRRWQKWFPVGLAAAATMLLIVLLPQITLDATDLQARLESDGSPFVFSVAVDLDSNQIDMSLMEGSAPDSGTFELWFIPDGGAPLSLGTFASGERLTLLPDVGLAPDATLAVSVEPSGGSPTGAPTGPVVALGALKDV